MPHRIKKDLGRAELQKHVEEGGIRKLRPEDRALARIQHGLGGVPFYYAHGKSRLRKRPMHAFWGERGNYLGAGSRNPLDVVDVLRMETHPKPDEFIEMHKKIYGLPKRPFYATSVSGRARFYDALGEPMEPAKHGDVDPHSVTAPRITHGEQGSKDLGRYKELYDLDRMPAYMATSLGTGMKRFWDRDGELIAARAEMKEVDEQLLRQVERRIEERETKAD